MEELYNALVEQGKYTKSFEDFTSTVLESLKKLNFFSDALNSSGDYKKTFETFRIN